MMAHYAIKKIDGSVAIMHTLGDAKPEDCVRQWTVEEQAKVVSVTPIDLADIPTDRTFRNAWKPDLSVDMEKAREIHKTRLRGLRAPMLAALDTEYMRADEVGDTQEKKRIAAKKQALRDVTRDPRIAAAETVEDLKKVTLD